MGDKLSSACHPCPTGGRAASRHAEFGQIRRCRAAHHACRTMPLVVERRLHARCVVSSYNFRGIRGALAPKLVLFDQARIIWLGAPTAASCIRYKEPCRAWVTSWRQEDGLAPAAPSRLPVFSFSPKPHRGPRRATSRQHCGRIRPCRAPHHALPHQPACGGAPSVCVCVVGWFQLQFPAHGKPLRRNSSCLTNVFFGVVGRSDRSELH